MDASSRIRERISAAVHDVEDRATGFGKSAGVGAFRFDTHTKETAGR